jgi:hypothetical protein
MPFLFVGYQWPPTHQRQRETDPAVVKFVAYEGPVKGLPGVGGSAFKIQMFRNE